MILTFSTLLSQLRLIKRFKLQVLSKRKLTLFSWGKIDQPSRISKTVQITHVFTMNFTHFLEIFLQQCVFHCNRPNGPKYANNDGQRFHGETMYIMLNSV